MRKTGVYVASGMPGGFHTSYHSDGRFHWRSRDPKFTERFEDKPPLSQLSAPIMVQSGTSAIDDNALELFNLSEFTDESTNVVIYLDNRILAPYIYYHVWVVPPFRHGQVPLHLDRPAYLHLVTHTNPWIQTVIYEQFSNGELSEAENHIETDE